MNYAAGMPIDVILVEPCFPSNQREFARALHAVGARVTGIGERPKEALDDSLRHWLSHYEQVGNVTDADQLEAAVRRVQRHVKLDRLEAVVEAHVMAALTGKMPWFKLYTPCMPVRVGVRELFVTSFELGWMPARRLSVRPDRPGQP